MRTGRENCFRLLATDTNTTKTSEVKFGEQMYFMDIGAATVRVRKTIINENICLF